jgi:hypothetical protein
MSITKRIALLSQSMRVCKVITAKDYQVKPTIFILLVQS